MANNFKGQKGTMYYRNIPRTLRDMFHSKCAREGRSMRSVVVELMRAYVRGDDPFKDKKIKPRNTKRLKK